MRSSSLEVALVHALVASGWERSYDRPPRVEPWRGRLVRDVSNGWAAVLQLDVDRPGDDDRDVPGAGRPESVEIEAGLTLPGAERLAAAMKLPIPSALALEMPGPPSGAHRFSGGGPGEDEDDHRRVIAEVLRFADEVVVPWAARHASADGWLAAQRTARDEYPVAFHGEDAPTVFVASNRPSEALEHLRLAERHPEFHHDDLAPAVANRLRAFIASGAPVPAPAFGLFPYCTYAPGEFDVDVRHDARHAAFMEATGRELRAQPARVRWRYLGGVGVKALEGLRSMRGGDRDHDVLERRWRSVPYDATSEAALGRAFDRAATRIAWQVMVVVLVVPAEDGTATVVLDGTTVGRVGVDDLPEDVNAWPEGRTPARLSRKPNAPRYLLELRLLADVGP